MSEQGFEVNDLSVCGASSEPTLEDLARIEYAENAALRKLETERLNIVIPALRKERSRNIYILHIASSVFCLIANCAFLSAVILWMLR